MAPGISLDDRSAWDDSALINSWDDAVAEYQHLQVRQAARGFVDRGRAEESAKVKRPPYSQTSTNQHSDNGDVLDETGDGADPRTDADATDSALPQVQANGVGQGGADAAHVKDGAAPVAQGSAQASGTELLHDGPISASMPQALLGSVQDENMKNLMMSWYYAGYYTGLVAGQQQRAPDSAAQQTQK
ncbi:uncharacterized protein CC84DRAFT_1242967 [Paraphaeosphaeria sporulosa]|uniref:Survival Motor Neuron Gemin2-binding domain-containing protein n=1 Tax=Paraphaeosphaeria sporulosa TaxID=1460663 RepID=A0A177CKV6_9PLEO|nr:uncharacterized protein CC84DRAFT_1242967 [Paraphaeosphaeria sporulosa]OAG07427.1 hypothetical protein CC84DRAFT_1242967 [Paraphaeosphaeria sporulosa]